MSDKYRNVRNSRNLENDDCDGMFDLSPKECQTEVGDNSIRCKRDVESESDEWDEDEIKAQDSGQEDNARDRTFSKIFENHVNNISGDFPLSDSHENIEILDAIENQKILRQHRKQKSVKNNLMELKGNLYQKKNDIDSFQQRILASQSIIENMAENLHYIDADIKFFTELNNLLNTLLPKKDKDKSLIETLNEYLQKYAQCTGKVFLHKKIMLEENVTDNLDNVSEPKTIKSAIKFEIDKLITELVQEDRN